MHKSTLITTCVLLVVGFSGCIGNGDWSNSFEPGTDYKATGNTVHIRMWVEDMVASDIYPGFEGNMWAFCAEPADPNDAYSAAAIEYREPAGVVQRLQSDGSFVLDEETTNKCSAPGPQLRVQQGDYVIVDFENDHFHAHTIHWHGQLLPWNADGVPGTTQDSVVPGTSYRYEYEAKRAGTLWYHCHVDTQFHVMQGLYGAIIVEPQEKKFEPKDVDREYTLVLSNLKRSHVEYIEGGDPHAAHKAGGNCGVTGNPGCQNPAVDVTPDVFMINGVSFPYTLQRDDTLMTIAPDETIRIRFVNAGPTGPAETIHLHGHDMYVTHRDGNPLPPAARFWVDSITIGVGERYDVLVHGSEAAEGIWVMHTHNVDHVTNNQQYPGGMLTKLTYEKYADDVTPFDGVELPGGGAPRGTAFPLDSVTSGRFELGTTNAVDQSWDFEIVKGCALKQYGVGVSIDSFGSVAQTLNDLTAVISKADGTEITTLDLGSSRYMEYNFDAIQGAFDGIHTEAGNITVRLTGTSNDAVATFGSYVDYFNDEAEHQAAGSPCNEDDH